MKNLTWQNPEQLFVAQELINKVKSKCCGIKEQRKSDYKLGIWYEFTGTVEYYICDDYPTIYDSFKSSKRASFINPQNPDGRPTKKVTSKAKIKIAAFKDHPVCYNIWFDNVGLGIDLNNLYF